ncbi:MAG: hypothetical protein CM1200mP16_13070 [Nitrospina sp.]|nr:MAG: hypothetical protein CM1200mP16_13070 [Nitrospina sp.]
MCTEALQLWLWELVIYMTLKKNKAWLIILNICCFLDTKIPEVGSYKKYLDEHSGAVTPIPVEI